MNFKEFLTEAGEQYERQESGIEKLVNILTKNGKEPISLKVEDKIIKNVISIKKHGGKTKQGKEPITDLIISTKDGKFFNVSAKGLSAPSFGGGGLEGLYYLIPKEISNFINKANKFYLNKGFKEGDIGLPDVSGKIPQDLIVKILASDTSQGGPINYIYVGPMEVSYDIELFEKKKILKLNGIFNTLETFATKHPLYFVVRKRTEKSPYTPKLKDKFGLPSIFGSVERVSSTGDIKKEPGNRRIVIYNKVRGELIK